MRCLRQLAALLAALLMCLTAVGAADAAETLTSGSSEISGEDAAPSGEIGVSDSGMGASKGDADSSDSSADATSDSESEPSGNSVDVAPSGKVEPVGSYEDAAPDSESEPADREAETPAAEACPPSGLFGFGLLGGGISSPEETQEITHIGSPAPQSTLLLFLSQDSDLTALALPKTIPCLISGARFPYFCPVEWSVDQLVPGTSGRQYIPGVLQPDTEYSFAEGLSAQVRYPVYFTGGEATESETLDTIEVEVLESTPVFRLAVDGDPAKLELTRYTAACMTKNPGEYFTCPLNWDFSAVNTHAPGLYTAAATPILPAGFAVPVDMVPITASVGVVSPDYVDLSAPALTTFGNLQCSFLYEMEDLSSVKVEYSVAGSTWQQDAGTTASAVNKGYYYECQGSSIIFYLSRLKLHTDYRFRVLYDTDQMSNVLSVRVDETTPTATASGVGGNRDGSNDPGNSLPDLNQPVTILNPSDSSDGGYKDGDRPSPSSVETKTPNFPYKIPVTGDTAPANAGGMLSTPLTAPQNAALEGSPAVLAENTVLPSAPSEQTAPLAVTEMVTETSTTLTGLRLNHLLAMNGEQPVLFEKQGVAVELPRAFLTGLGLDDAALFTVTIEQPETDSFSLSIMAGVKTSFALPSTVVRLPWVETQDRLECVDETGAHVSSAHYESEFGTVSCTIYATGTYSIRPLPEKAETPTPLSVHTGETAPKAPAVEATAAQPRALLCGAALLSVAAAGFSLLKKRHE